MYHLNHMPYIESVLIVNIVLPDVSLTLMTSSLLKSSLPSWVIQESRGERDADTSIFPLQPSRGGCSDCRRDSPLVVHWPHPSLPVPPNLLDDTAFLHQRLHIPYKNNCHCRWSIFRQCVRNPVSYGCMRMQKRLYSLTQSSLDGALTNCRCNVIQTKQCRLYWLICQTSPDGVTRECKGAWILSLMNLSVYVFCLWRLENSGNVSVCHP